VTPVVFRIKDATIPAEYFTAGVFGHEKHAEELVTKYLKDRDGKITVDAFWVNPPTLKKAWTGDPDRWIEGRQMLGKLVPPIDPERNGPGGG
jgi:hypothetical protein